MMRRKRGAIVLASLLIAGLCSVILVLVPSPAIKAVASFVLDIIVPGVLLYRLVFRHEREHSLVDAILFALGLGYCFAALVTLGLHYIPGQLTRPLSLGLFDALLAGLLAANVIWPYDGQFTPLTRREWWGIAGVLLLAALFRLPNLSYSEFQGDETAVLHKAAGAIQGRDDALFLHHKGPVEILLTLLPYAQGMALNEWGVRLPFSLASLLSVLGLYRLGARAFGHRAGLWTAVLVALNGFFAAFGRILQYQSLVLLFSALGVLAAQFYATTRRQRYVWLSALFLGVGLLCHTDTVFALLPAAWLIVAATPGPRRLSRLLALCWGPVLLGALMLATFYVPYVLSDAFGETTSYLAMRMGDAPPYNNFSHLLEIGTVYNAVYYLVLVGAIVLWVSLRRAAEASKLRWVLPAIIVVLLAQAVVQRDAWSYGGHDWLGFVFVVLAAAVLLAPARQSLWQPAYAWFVVPFLIYMFLFRDPRTHVYIFFPGALLVMGAQFAHWQDALQSRRWLVTAGVAPLALASAAYLFLVLVNHSPEYIRTYPEHRVRFFWTPYGDVLPEQGLFGFPYRAGWKAVGQLFQEHVLVGDYGTNEEPHITRWYTRAENVSKNDARYFVVAENVQDERNIPRDTIQEEYTLSARVLVEGVPKIHIYQLDAENVTPVDYDVAQLAGRFDRESSTPWYDTDLETLDPLAGMQESVGSRLGERIELVGYAVNSQVLSDTQALTVTLYWRALAPIEEQYRVYVQIQDADVVWLERDDVPRTGYAPTNEWEVGDIVVDRHTLWLRSEAPVGPHDLVVGMFDIDTGERLEITEGPGVDNGGAITLRSIEIQ